MKIGQVSGVSGTYDTKGLGKVNKTNGVQSKKDATAISNEGQLVSKVAQAMSAVPNIRQSEIDRLKPLVDNGNYNVQGKDILEKMASKMDKNA